MSQVRKVVVMDSNGKIWTEEQPTPEPESGQLLVEVRASMVSPGSGLGGVKGRRANPEPNPTKRPFGYTNAGVVIGKKGNCDEFSIGDRVSGMVVVTRYTQRTPVYRTICVRRSLRM